MRRFLLPVLFSIIFISESIFVELLPKEIVGGNHWILAPRFLMIALLLLTIYGSKKQGIIYGLIFGLLFDIVYTEVLGIYFFMFPLISFIVSQLMRIFQTNVILVSFVTLVGVILLELGVYELNFLIKITDMDFQVFFSERFIPTLVLNLLFLIIAIYPFKKLYEKITEPLHD